MLNKPCKAQNDQFSNWRCTKDQELKTLICSSMGCVSGSDRDKAFCWEDNGTLSWNWGNNKHSTIWTTISSKGCHMMRGFWVNCRNKSTKLDVHQKLPATWSLSRLQLHLHHHQITLSIYRVVSKWVGCVCKLCQWNQIFPIRPIHHPPTNPTLSVFGNSQPTVPASPI